MSINNEFITKFSEELGEDFFFCDTIDQDELFEKQDTLAKLIAEYANKGSSSANLMVKKLPRLFN